MVAFLLRHHADAKNPAADADPPPPDLQVARIESSMKSVFDNERGHGAMIAMEGGVLDPTTTGGSAAAAEYAPGDEVVHDGEWVMGRPVPNERTRLPRD